MSDQEGDDEQVAQRMDALLLRLLKTPPQSRAELSEQVRRAKGKKEAAMDFVIKDGAIIGVAPPLGFVWQSLGKWPDAGNSDTSPETDREASSSIASPPKPASKQTARRSSRRRHRVAIGQRA
jgi:hypothetical protein